MHTDFANLAYRPKELKSLPLTYKIGNVPIGSKNWIFAHANSRMLFELNPAQYSTLTFEMGLDDVNGADPGSVVYVVKGDGRELYRSPVIRAMSAPASASVDIKGVRRLDLIVEDGGDGIASDEAYWIDLRAK